MTISDRYPELISKIEAIHFKVAENAIKQLQEVNEMGYMPADLRVVRRSFWKISYPYFRSWDRLCKR